MLEAFRKAFKIKDIRKKIGYTFLMLIVIRIGSQLPTPGVNGEYIKNFFAQNTGEAFNLFNAFTGGSFEQMSVFALSIPLFQRVGAFGPESESDGETDAERSFVLV